LNKFLIVSLAFFLGTFGASADDFPDYGFSSSDTIFAATFNGLDGKPVALADFKGKPLVLNFWATWCPPCRKEIPELVEIHNRFGARGVVLVGVAVEEPTRVPEFVKANDINYHVVVGNDQGIRLLQTLGNKSAGLPYTVVLDRAGRIVFTQRGAVTRERLEQVLEPLL